MRVRVSPIVPLILLLVTSWTPAQDRSSTRSTGDAARRARTVPPANQRPITGGPRPSFQGMPTASQPEFEPSELRSESIPDAPSYDERAAAFDDTSSAVVRGATAPSAPRAFSADSEVRDIATSNEPAASSRVNQQHPHGPGHAGAAESMAQLPASPATDAPTSQLTSAATATRELEPVPLSPRTNQNQLEEGNAGVTPLRALPQAWSSIVTVLASLGVVLGLFFIVAWIMRRGVPGTIPILPKSAVEVLGRMPMPGRQQMQLLRCGNKLLLVYLSQSGAETLTEITSPEEVDRLAGLCQQRHANSSSKAFQDVLEQLGRDRRDPDDFEPEPFGARLTAQRSTRRAFDRGVERDG